jgi:glycosyltransferase involved in cell wall biosynthesis
MPGLLKMKDMFKSIAVVTSVHPALDQRVFYKEAVTLANSGYLVTLIAQNGSDEDLINEETSKRGISYRPLRRATRRFDRVWIWLDIWHHLKALKCDVWHFHDPELLPILIIFRVLIGRRVKLVYDLHEDTPQDILSKYWINPRLRQLISSIAALVERKCSSYCAVVITVVDTIKTRIEAGGAHVVVIRNYPDLSKFSAEIREGRLADGVHLHVIYVGVISKSRGLLEMVEAMSELVIEPITLTLVGNQSPPDVISSSIEVLPKNIEYIGPVPYDQVPILLRTYDVGLACIHPTPSYIDALPVKVLEYMAAGLAVVCSNFSMLKSIVEETHSGICVDPTDSKQIAASLRQMLTDTCMLNSQRKSARETAMRNYSWESEATKLLEVYRTL